MTKWMLAAGAAALAIASPVSADKGGHAKGQGGQNAQVDRGGDKKQARSNGGGGNRQVRMNSGGGNRQAHAQRGGGNPEFRAAQGGQGNRQARQTRFVQSDNRGRSNDRVRIEKHGSDRARVARVDDNRGRGGGPKTVQLDRGRDVARVRQQGNRVVDLSGDKVFRVRDVDRGVVRFRDVDRDELFARRLGYGVGGCPPGLAKKGNGCMPPGQAARFIGQPLIAATRLAALEPLPRSFRSLYWDNDDYYYRYGGGYLYQVDRDTALISAVAALLTGGLSVGQQLPVGYSAYNVPLAYRSTYYDRPDVWYRYDNGYIYAVDPGTQLVRSVAYTIV